MIRQRIAALRELMANNAISAFIIPSSDPHMSEYVADHWKCRQWISGFSGSAGTVVVTSDKAGLWTDSRYFIQAASELHGSGIELYKEGLDDTPSITDFLAENLAAGQSVGIDGYVFSDSSASALKDELSGKSLLLRTDIDPFASIWDNRPPMPSHYAFAYPEELSGESIRDKKKRILDSLHKVKANAILLTTLDEIAWTFNMRGSDVECNPVAICYAVITEDKSILFIDSEKVTSEFNEYLADNGIITASYCKIAEYLNSLPASTAILTDPAKVNEFLFNNISKEATQIKSTSPVALMKAVKNKVEIEGFRKALVKDGVALVRFNRWLEQNIPAGTVTETGIAAKLIEFRDEQEGFVGESFGTIAGWAGHGAIVHYSASKESDATITTDSMLLIDSGGQYLDGTTDITRTFAIGTPCPEMKRDFTLVLKGHINLASAVFPTGTRGDQLDSLARIAMWKHMSNYLHGTGHGIGHFLNVHEGPQSIRLNHNPTTLQPGMVTSNEPGLYLSDRYGIRLENLILTTEAGESEFGKFLKFETLTLFPFDKKAIDTSMLSIEERAWINNYHKMVFDKLSPSLDHEEREWLESKTAAI